VRKINLAISLLICLSATARSRGQAQAPQLLVRAAHCLAVKDNFPSSKTKTLSFGYLLDEKSYPGEKVLYLVNYAAPTGSTGLVFAIFLTEHEGRQVFNIQNNASFVLSKDDRDGVSFVNPPLGGTWTQSTSHRPSQRSKSGLDLLFLSKIYSLTLLSPIASHIQIVRGKYLRDCLIVLGRSRMEGGCQRKHTC
jgi:hypothetical protein